MLFHVCKDGRLPGVIMGEAEVEKGLVEKLPSSFALKTKYKEAISQKYQYAYSAQSGKYVNNNFCKRQYIGYLRKILDSYSQN